MSQAQFLQTVMQELEEMECSDTYMAELNNRINQLKEQENGKHQSNGSKQVPQDSGRS